VLVAGLLVDLVVGDDVLDEGLARRAGLLGEFLEGVGDHGEVGGVGGDLLGLGGDGFLGDWCSDWSRHFWF